MLKIYIKNDLLYKVKYVMVVLKSNVQEQYMVKMCIKMENIKYKLDDTTE